MCDASTHTVVRMHGPRRRFGATFLLGQFPFAEFRRDGRWWLKLLNRMGRWLKLLNGRRGRRQEGSQERRWRGRYRHPAPVLVSCAVAGPVGRGRPGCDGRGGGGRDGGGAFRRDRWRFVRSRWGFVSLRHFLKWTSVTVETRSKFFNLELRLRIEQSFRPTSLDAMRCVPGHARPHWVAHDDAELFDQEHNA